MGWILSGFGRIWNILDFGFFFQIFRPDLKNHLMQLPDVDTMINEIIPTSSWSINIWLVCVSVQVKEEGDLGGFLHGNICFLFSWNFPKGSQERTLLRLISLRVCLRAGQERGLRKKRLKRVRVLTSAGNQKKKESLCCVSSDLAFCALPLLSECMLLLVIIKPLL